jgi:glutamine---fructose-6-phosphate transaminase (isomerizing)
MCGLVGVVRRPPEGAPPELAPLLKMLEAAVARLGAEAFDQRGAGALHEAAAEVQAVARTLRGPLGSGALLADPVAMAAFGHRATEITARLGAIEAVLDAAAATDVDDAQVVEDRNAALVACKDAVWALQWDRLGTARAIEDLAGRGPIERAALAAYHSIQVTLSALDRLEVRGRDSAGLHVLVTGHGLDLADADVARLIAGRGADPLFAAGSVRVAHGHLGFVYKTAAEIGELGDNTARLRAQIRDDDLLRLALRSESAEAAVLAHTRWASVGIISEPNAHPLNQEELAGPGAGIVDGPYVTAALNGDVDNYADLKALEGLRLPAEITTDAKVIPALVSRRIAAHTEVDEAFRTTVASFEGSVAIGAQAAAEPGKILLALRGSGQALYVGLGDDCFVVASEPYGVVEECDRYLRLDGETMVEAANPASQGQVVIVDAARAGTLDGIERRSYDGRSLPIVDAELQRPEITTRDVARGDVAHYLLKEMAEAPASFRKTLRGRIVERAGRLDVRLPPETMSPAIVDRLRRGAVRRVLAIGQGSAHVAGRSLARALRDAVGPRPIAIEALTATELSGFGLTADMSDTLVVAISQSGTTTDTNRTVDLARSRGAVVIAIVNRRQSDLVDKSDGVLYTSDGRDVEMSVASTKAFYAQLAAGYLLAFGLATELGADGDADRSYRHELLGALRELPEAMSAVFARRPAIALAAQRHALSRRSWAVVGNGVNQIAALELRIKLSELCYKSIACDVTEDKKHIDLSSEPMVVVCAAGLHGSNADDVAKEVAIYRAHKAAPIVIADDDETRFATASAETISVPVVHPSLSFVLCALAGHLFGYEAALAIDASARPLRAARGCVEALVGAAAGSASATDRDPLAELSGQLEPLAGRFFDGLRAGDYDGSLEAGTAVQLASLLRYAVGVVPLDAYQIDFGKVGTPSTVVEDLTAALTKAIEELTRPVDAIKHQAKTVTVGISRSDETLLQVPLVREVLASGTPRDSLTYRALRTLVALDAAVDSVVGWTRYRIEGDPTRGPATIHVVDRGGIARDIPSRTDANPVLRGTKHRVATEREVTVVLGRADQRTLIEVPEVKGAQTTGITLLHVRFRDQLTAGAARRVLEGYRDRYQAIADQVTEVEPVMRDDVLGRIGLVELLTEPVVRLADHWKQ